MSQGFDRYIAWLDFTGHDQPPGYYGLLKLAMFEANVDRIQDAILHESLDVSNYLKGTKRQLAEAVLEEIARAESCLTNLDSKASYDAQLRAWGNAVAGELAPCPLQEISAFEDEPVRLVEVDDIAIPEIFHVNPASMPSLDAEPAAATTHSASAFATTARPRPAAASSLANSAAAVADRSVLDAVERVRRRTQDQTRKKSVPAAAPEPSEPNNAREIPAAAPVAAGPAAPTISLPTAIAYSIGASIPAPLVKHRRRIAIAVACLVGLGFVVERTMIALDKPPAPRVRVRLDPQEEALLCEQITILYDPGRETADRATAIEKLREASPEGIKQSAYRIKDLASRQPEPELQEALQKLLESSGIEP